MQGKMVHAICAGDTGNVAVGKRVLSIDWGRKRLGLAYAASHNHIIFPLGQLDTHAGVLFDIAGLVIEHAIDTIIVGMPGGEQSASGHSVQGAIKKFAQDLGFVIDPSIPIHFVNESYSSIQAQHIQGVFKKTAGEDSRAAAVLLEEWFAKHGLIK